MKINLSATGTWKIKNLDKEYYGDLYLNEDKGGIILYIRIPNNGPMLSFLELPLTISFINGSTLNGAKIVLVDCVRVATQSRIGSEEVFGYQANFMFEGINFESEESIKFSKIQIGIPHIIKWGDISNYKRPDIEDTKTAIGLDITEPIEIYSCEDYILSYYLSFNDSGFDLMREKITLTQTPFLIIESKTIQSLDWFIKIANQMKRLIEIAMSESLSFDKIIAESPEIYYEFDDDTRHVRPVEVKHALKQKSKNNLDENKLRPDFLFNLNELRNASFSKWQDISLIMEPIIELYIDSIYNQGLSTNRHFLNMVQALETYHARRICNSLSNFKNRVEELTIIEPAIEGKITVERYNQSDKDFLLDGSYKYITLRSRLADLLLADHTFIFYTADIDYFNFPKVIADTRNYYTHYDKKLENRALKGEDLINGFHILRNILEFYLLKEFGFEEEFIHDRTRERIRPIITSNSVKEAAKNKRYV
ncbi:HEPN domain-containing protein [Halalkalibacter akibai]|uniref:Uncharacterized protein n=1 Tax=Halalkalibacter akibai (strain ATCC 43226 / DSM 21942 / CIP 109018 / JCM 9157 / 1139) TaxID=1236973 RepID=W4QZW4_HALA3|nr:HEPN domain-containing protein [Halalkalibacter akibai]GAE37675.1 hypothetical protein JCM9157_4993 [Halalkalibacter akibai JCM 9157]